MTPIDFIAASLMILGAVFFLAGSAGLLRFPDVYTRLHALTKTDNAGLGLMVAGLAVQTDSWFVVAKMLVIYLLVMLAGASVAYLIARGAVERGIKMWRR